jgi:hypothetical protein
MPQQTPAENKKLEQRIGESLADYIKRYAQNQPPIITDEDHSADWVWEQAK